MSDSVVLQSIRDLLNGRDISFREVHHEPTLTSENAARARGEELRIGGKALLIKGGDEYRLFVLPADRKIDSAAIRRELNLRKLRFANRDELMELTGLVPGSVPPFGRPIFPFELFVDSGIRENERIAFNAGSLTDSIVMPVRDYLCVSCPSKIFAFSSVGRSE